MNAVIHSVYHPVPARILRTEQLTELEKLFEIQLPNGPLGHRAGQFVQISLLGVGEVPISVSSGPDRGPTFELVIRKAGTVTSALHTLGAGSMVGIRGPYGNGFPMKDLQGSDLLVMAGGIGLVPLRSVIHHVLDHRADYGRLVILYGARDPSQILFRQEIEQWEARDDVEFHVTVDRADASWQGHVGVITTLVPPLRLDVSRTVALVCGPPVMFKYAIMALRSKGLSDEQIYLSLEGHMKCGLGKCGRCQVGHLYVCYDGPVFCYADIKDIKEAL